MIVRIPSPLFSYTKGQAQVEGQGATLRDVLDDLERRFPGIRFRIVDEQDRLRTHITIYIGGRPTRDLSSPASGEVMIVAALSGG